MAKKAGAKTDAGAAPPGADPDGGITIAVAPAFAVGSVEVALAQDASRLMADAVTEFQQWTVLNNAALAVSVTAVLGSAGGAATGERPQAMTEKLEPSAAGSASATPALDSRMDELIKRAEHIDNLVLGSAAGVAADVWLLVDALAEGMVTLELAVNLQNQISLSTAATAAAYSLMLQSPERSKEALELIRVAQEAVRLAQQQFDAAEIPAGLDDGAHEPAGKGKG